MPRKYDPVAKTYHSHVVKVRFHHCDHAGHTNNVAYAGFLESAREEMLYEVGMLEASTELVRLRFTTARIWIDYLAETFFGDELDVRSWISRMGTSSFDIGHSMVRGSDGVEVARGGCVMVCYDYERKQSKPLTNDDREALSRYS